MKQDKPKHNEITWKKRQHNHKILNKVKWKWISCTKFNLNRIKQHKFKLFWYNVNILGSLDSYQILPY